MPDKPLWYNRLETAVQQLETFPSPWIDRATLESVLGVSTRRAQQILRPLVQRSIGKNGLASKVDVLAYLRNLSAGEAAVVEQRRRERFQALLEHWRTQALRQPQVLVEAPEAIVNQELNGLPSGVQLSPGRIVLEGFATPAEAKEILLALIMAIGNDPEGFDERISFTKATR